MNYNHKWINPGLLLDKKSVQYIIEQIDSIDSDAIEYADFHTEVMQFIRNLKEVYANKST